ncbi:hypothetical protein MMSR116_24730 [Methylobacterium mesophilicum SR1.6/6]|uniref:Uncharacterized protein n=1 Tax=Methylobacterium mesophilicum SR1.6/6 TaxID=908290 RepID=A0A6B9FQ76_9HYPH|nr:hypothetical protein [Methylobacterium mesophilicum]QGY04751.1 hypothetical protein MMSR116_24730 [Methylobacterium mesophilicum SR1.6/6]
MVGRAPDQNPGGHDGDGPSEAARPDMSGGPADGRARREDAATAERERAETEIAAGDIADDLADFA